MKSTTCGVLALVMILGVCCGAEPEIEEIEVVTTSPPVPSPSGAFDAWIVESGYGRDDGTTQVMLSFRDRNCGAGAVAAVGVDLGLELRWIDDTTLEVRHPKTIVPIRNASGETVQCYERKVKVVLTPA